MRYHPRADANMDAADSNIIIHELSSGIKVGYGCPQGSAGARDGTDLRIELILECAKCRSKSVFTGQEDNRRDFPENSFAIANNWDKEIYRT
ncbi:hypothetical protein Nepgr_016856 [Nepenthes gracilis]|uniref:Uncharacterized protein n=1 Tax=Nepenthes gracilis TaxID=150966 RepID=A0AAD3XSV7_NEPGR|nr:hypothetical protein Nepgr_016856 [Nepenthes gracilis]